MASMVVKKLKKLLVLQQGHLGPKSLLDFLEFDANKGPNMSFCPFSQVWFVQLVIANESTKYEQSSQYDHGTIHVPNY